jgi:hypothetical protein
MAIFFRSINLVVWCFILFFYIITEAKVGQAFRLPDGAQSAPPQNGGSILLPSGKRDACPTPQSGKRDACPTLEFFNDFMLFFDFSKRPE